MNADISGQEQRSIEAALRQREELMAECQRYEAENATLLQRLAALEAARIEYGALVDKEALELETALLQLLPSRSSTDHLVPIVTANRAVTCEHQLDEEPTTLALSRVLNAHLQRRVGGLVQQCIQLRNEASLQNNP